MRKPNYDKYPSTKISGQIVAGWENIVKLLEECPHSKAIAIDLYTGTMEVDIFERMSNLRPRLTDTRSLMKSASEIEDMTAPFMTEDSLFGHLSNLDILDFFSAEKLRNARNECDADTVVIGTGASLVVPEDAVIVYADMARWEIQCRSRRHEVHGLGVDDSSEAPSIQYKRGYFIDWNVLDRYKGGIMDRVDFWLDTNDIHLPKLISSESFREGIMKTARSPFRVVPFFDPAPWGGQWMKTVCDLDRDVPNFGWCFDCVPEENSLLLESGGIKFELPAQDLVISRTTELLGEAVEARFGKSFPIRFDFLDTMQGGNLSVQVHPTTRFIREEFGMPYTQDESYYLLDAGEDACVFLGLKDGVDRNRMMSDLRQAQKGDTVFDVGKYINRFPAKKHDHFLIPAGTVHCSGANAMVLEISATPNIFTFKLWDWQRMGLDGKPRPINVERGGKVINWDRTTGYVRDNLINRFSAVSSGDGWEEIRTGLHPEEFIETRRVRFSRECIRSNNGSVHVLNLVEGDEAVVESVDGSFEPLVVHYAETFIVPASCRQYILKPSGPSEGRQCMVITAYIRIQSDV